MIPEFVQIAPADPHLYGAGAAHRHLEVLKPFFTSLHTQPLLIGFDFSETQSVSGSYLRATLLWCLMCGKSYAEGQPLVSPRDPWSVRPLPFYPVVVGGSREILEDVDDLLKQRNLACLLVDAKSSFPYKEAVVLGSIDGFLLDTLRILSERGPATAQSMKEASNERITAGGWSNRLAALHAGRLVSRTREGKFWIYRTLAEDHKLWA